MKNFYQKPLLWVLTCFIVIVPVYAQNVDFVEPREENLLNNLKVLIWKQPDNGKVNVSLRIHNGAAFDKKDRMGTMVLLSQTLFPEELKAFFKEDLEGNLDTKTTYDYIQITASGKSDKLVTILETIASAVKNPTINKNTTAALKKKQLIKLVGLNDNSDYVADRSAAKKLLGNFPYGRPIEGTKESVSKITDADVIEAKQRFLTSDNATLAISGDVNPNFAYKAARRLFGGWIKSDERVPSYFRLPEKPDTSLAPIPNDGEKVDLVHAVNGASRRNNKYFSSKILEKILISRSNAGNNTAASAVRYDSHLLRGVYFVTARLELEGVNPNQETIELNNVGNLFKLLLRDKISQEEFDYAKSVVLFDIKKRGVAYFWLDIDTYKLKSFKDEMKKLSDASLNDVHALANELSNEPHVAVVLAPVKKIEKDKVSDTLLPTKNQK